MHSTCSHLVVLFLLDPINTISSSRRWWCLVGRAGRQSRKSDWGIRPGNVYTSVPLARVSNSENTDSISVSIASHLGHETLERLKCWSLTKEVVIWTTVENKPWIKFHSGRCLHITCFRISNIRLTISNIFFLPFTEGVPWVHFWLPASLTPAHVNSKSCHKTRHFRSKPNTSG